MVGHPSVETANVDNKFDFIDRNIQRKEANKIGTNTCLHPRPSEKHIQICETEWRRLGYKDERIWSHLFPSTLDDLPNK